ncbi:MAG: C1 family peptidase [Dehalococcoidales bacterium]|nr:C1 family peptidase [Dehalococcoidales bacterium]
MFPNTCNGGSDTGGLKFLQTDRAVRESAYPYTRVQATCRASEIPEDMRGPLLGPIGKVMQLEPACDNYSRKPCDKELKLKDALEKYGPLVVNINAENWQNYAQGIFPNNMCSGGVDHTVQLVGFGSERNRLTGKDEAFWLIRNSWSAEWGEVSAEKTHEGEETSRADVCVCVCVCTELVCVVSLFLLLLLRLFSEWFHSCCRIYWCG